MLRHVLLSLLCWLSRPIAIDFADLTLLTNPNLGKPRDISPADILSCPSIRSFSGYARAQWKDLKPYLHPTQPDVGYAWVMRKVRKDFWTKQDAEKEMSPEWAADWPNIKRDAFADPSRTVPVIIGPASNASSELVFYALDSHHTVSALDYAQHRDVFVYLDVVADWRALSFDAFAAHMVAQNNTYLFAQHAHKKAFAQPIDFAALPTTFEFNEERKSLGDSAWRSLAGYSRKVEQAPAPFAWCDAEGDYKYCMRAFVRQCDADGFAISFFEFMWAHFFVDACYLRNGFWHGAQGDEPLAAFTAKYDALLSEYYDEDGVWKNLKRTADAFEAVEADWLTAASLLVPLARAQMAGSYAMPPQFADVCTLPGYVEGELKLGKDPDCDFRASFAAQAFE